MSLQQSCSIAAEVSGFHPSLSRGYKLNWQVAARFEKTKAFPRPALITVAARFATDDGGKLFDLHRLANLPEKCLAAIWPFLPKP